MKIFYKNKKKSLIFLFLALGLLIIKYSLFYIDYDQFHVVIKLSTFAFYLIILFYATAWLIKKKQIILTNITILIILLCLGELVCYMALGMPKEEWKSYDIDDLPPDHIGTHLGHVPWADSVWHDVKIVEDKTIFDAYYSIDSINRRITPGYDENKNKYAVFFGCSIGFGLGLKDDQTIPYYVQQNTENYNSYNYAFTGWGCHHMLARLEHKDLSKEVREKEGVGVYIFLWSHIRRAIGDMRIYTGWGHAMPYYYLKDGELIKDGNFKTGRWFISTIYEYLSRSNIANYFQINLPTDTREGHMILAAEIIKKAKEIYIKQFGNDKFYVVIHPTNWTEFTPEKNEQFKGMLKERRINVLDYSKKIVLDNNHIIIGDGHPNEKCDEEFAKLLIEDLKLK